MNTSVQTFRHQIDDYDKQIQDETRRLAADTQAKREESQRNIEAARNAVAAKDGAIKDITDKMRTVDETMDAIKKEGEAKERELGELRKKISNAEQMLARVKESEKNKLVAYGQNIPQLLENIKRTKWLGDEPLGPLGMFVKVKEPEKWAELLRNQMGGVLTAFAVTDARDQKTLKKMLVASGKYVELGIPLSAVLD
jgi:chromosome segregation ATPase